MNELNSRIDEMLAVYEADERNDVSYYIFGPNDRKSSCAFGSFCELLPNGFVVIENVLYQNGEEIRVVTDTFVASREPGRSSFLLMAPLGNAQIHPDEIYSLYYEDPTGWFRSVPTNTPLTFWNRVDWDLLFGVASCVFVIGVFLFFWMTQ